jgi:hypothetical protein
MKRFEKWFTLNTGLIHPFMICLAVGFVWGVIFMLWVM